MARPLRIEFEGATYHVCARGNERQKVFRDDRDRAHFLKLLEESLGRYQVLLLSFVLMGNHFHLLARTERANLSRWMHWLMVVYTVGFNRRHRRSGHLFQGRYKSFLVGEGEGRHLLTLSRYLHLNPVRGRVLGRGSPWQRRERLRRYEWSSYVGCSGLGKPFKFMSEASIFNELGGSVRTARVRYRGFVEEGLTREIENPLEAVRWQIALGNESFVRRIQDRIGRVAAAGRDEVTALRRAEPLTEARTVVQKVAVAYGLSAKELRAKKSYGSEARSLAIWLVWQHCGLSLRQVGEFFGGMKYGAVAQRLRRQPPGAEAKAKKLLGQM